MEVSATNNNALEIQSLLMDGVNTVNRSNKGNDNTNQTAEYAKKGEPMYMAEMDSDEDGVVTLDEYREYCKSKGIKTDSVLKMSQLAASYRTMKAESEVMGNILKLKPNTHSNTIQKNFESVYAKQGDGKYNLSMDANNDKTVTYKEYMEYCQKNAVSHGIKANAKFEETNDGLKITNVGKAFESYKMNESAVLKSTFENVT